MQLATNVKKPLSLHPWALRIPFGLVQNKFPQRTTLTQKRQNKYSEVVFPFDYESGCLMMKHCPPTVEGAFVFIFLTYLVPVSSEACLLEIPGEMLALES